MGDDALKSLTSAKKVVRLKHNLFITANNLKLAMDKLRDIIKKYGYANV